MMVGIVQQAESKFANLSHIFATETIFGCACKTKLSLDFPFLGLTLLANDQKSTFYVIIWKILRVSGLIACLPARQ